MKLISFLLENIYWVIVIGGVLFSMFGRSGSKRRSNRMPSFGGGNDPQKPGNRQDPAWEEEDEEEYQPQKPIMTSSSSQGEGMGSGEGTGSQALERAVQAATGRPSEPPRAGLGATKPKPQAAVSAVESRTEITTPKAEELRKAIVWAEILGPPRSKRPFGK